MTALVGGFPLVATSLATSKALILADASGPTFGMKEIGSQLRIITRRMSTRTTETSTPGLGPRTTLEDLRPVNLVITFAIILGLGFPRRGDMDRLSSFGIFFSTQR